jgi:hypothetical protein
VIDQTGKLHKPQGALLQKPWRFIVPTGTCTIEASFAAADSWKPYKEPHVAHTPLSKPPIIIEPKP